MATELNEKIDQIINARDDIKAELQLKSGEMVTNDIRTYAAIINSLNGGSDLSNANVIPEDISLGKLAYANNGLIQGTATTGNLIANVTDINYNNGQFNINYNGFNNAYHFYNSDMISLQTNQTNIANAINLTSEKIITGESVLGVIGNGTTIPNGLFIQDSIPTKTTSEALWAKMVTSGKASTQISPDEGTGVWRADYDAYTTTRSCSWKWQDIYERLTEEQIEQFDSYDQHLIFLYRTDFRTSTQTIYVLAADSIIRTSNGIRTTGETMIITCGCNGDSQQTFNITIQTDYVLTGDILSKYYAFNTILNSDGSVAYESDVTDTEDGIYVTINGVRYIVYTNKINSWNKILDTADATATNADILQDKTAYVNNKKLTGSMINRGDIIITPDINVQTSGAGYYNSVTVNSTPLMNKTVNPLVESQTITPEEGYVGLSSVIINPVTGTIDSNIQPENIRNGVNILGISGNYEGSGGGGSGDYNAKLFTNYESMMNDSNAKEGDFATVYGSSISNVNNESLSGTIHITKSVTLSPEDIDSMFWGFQWTKDSEYVYFGQDTMYDPPLIYLKKGNWSAMSEDFNFVWETQDRTNYICNNSDFSDVLTLTGSYSGDTMYSWSNMITHFMKQESSFYGGSYKYLNNEYSPVSTQFSSKQDMITAATSFMGGSGVFNMSALTNFYNIPEDEAAMKLDLYDKTIGNSVIMSFNTSINGSQFYWRYPNVINQDRVVSVLTNAKISGNTDLMFYNGGNITQVPNMNTVNSQNMHGMFYNCTNITSVPDYDTSNVIDFSNMFTNCYNLQTYPNFNLNNQANLAYMFTNCYNLQVSDINIENIEITSNMFNSAFYEEYEGNTFSNVNIRNINNASGMFASTRLANFIDVTFENINEVNVLFTSWYYFTSHTNLININIINCINGYSMFGSLVPRLVENIYISNGDNFSSCFYGGSTHRNNILINNVNSIDYMFQNTYNISGLRIDNVNSLNGLFSYSNYLQNINNVVFSNLNNANVFSMFQYCTNIVDLDNINIHFENCNNLSFDSMFVHCWALNSVNFANKSIFNYARSASFLFGFAYQLGEVTGLNLCNCYNIENMFWNCYNLQTIELTNISNITNLFNFFYQRNSMNTNLRTVSILDASNVINAGRMFYNCSNLQNLNINNLQNLEDASYMFYDCGMNGVYNFNLPSVTDASYMFRYCGRITSITINMENVTNMENMFANCSNLTDITFTGNYGNVTSVNCLFGSSLSLSDAAINNIVNMLLNCTNVTYKVLYRNASNSVFNYGINESRYQSRREELTAAGWTY